MYKGDYDYDGVHINSGISNRAFYLVGKGLNDKPSWEWAGRIWYDALTDKKTDSDCDFVR